MERASGCVPNRRRDGLRRGDDHSRRRLKEAPASRFVGLAAVPPFDVWGDAVRARKVEGERITLAVVELAPNAMVPEHRHDAEQMGIVIQGSVTFTIDGETRDLGPGGRWRILPNRPHTVQGGPEGAVAIDVFTPIRADWERYELLAPRPPVWPRRGGTPAIALGPPTPRGGQPAPGAVMDGGGLLDATPSAHRTGRKAFRRFRGAHRWHATWAYASRIVVGQGRAQDLPARGLAGCPPTRPRGARVILLPRARVPR